MFALFLAAACSTPAPPAPPPSSPPPAPAAPAPPPPAPAATAPAGLAPVAIPPDGKHENVKVMGVTVPMVNLMDGGTVLLVDTDGVKPRSWEEQYKRKGDLPAGYFDLHKTNVDRDDSFENDPIDRQGRWKMDESGNLTQD